MPFRQRERGQSSQLVRHFIRGHNQKRQRNEWEGFDHQNLILWLTIDLDLVVILHPEPPARPVFLGTTADYPTSAPPYRLHLIRSWPVAQQPPRNASRRPLAAACPHRPHPRYVIKTCHRELTPPPGLGRPSAAAGGTLSPPHTYPQPALNPRCDAPAGR